MVKLLESERDFLINEARRSQKENGRMPDQKDMKKSNGYPSIWRYYEEFGSWSNAIDIIFLGKKDCEMEREFLSRRMLEFKEKDNRMPTSFDMNMSNGYPSRKRYFKEFRTWSNAVDVVVHKREPNMTEREFLTFVLLKFKKEHEKIPQARDMKECKGYPSMWRFKKEFGLWQNAINEVFYNRNDTPDEYFFSPDNMNLRKWYIVGYIIGDGHVCGNSLGINSTENDKENL
jgi:hypothetical protein